jgi:hypothetical protein
MTEVTLFPLWVTVFITIWGLVAPFIGTLFGVWMGHHFSRSQQRMQWLTDNKVREWQELLTTLTTSFTTIVGTNPSLPKAGDEIERMKENFLARKMANDVLFNRLFIAGEELQHGLYKKWRHALEEFDQDHDPAKFGTAWGKINALILAGARADIEKV